MGEDAVGYEEVVGGECGSIRGSEEGNGGNAQGDE